MISKLLFSFLLVTLFYGHNVDALKTVDLKGNKLTPVITPFDDYGNINLKAIPKYIDYLIKHNLTTIWLFAVSGEPYSLNINERKLILDTWLASKYRKNLVIVVGIGFMTFDDSCEFAKYCELKKVDAVVYKTQTDAGPSDADQAASDVSLMAQCAPLTSLYILHNFNFDCCRQINYGELVRQSLQNVPNFAGLISDVSVAEQARSYNTRYITEDYQEREQYILFFYNEVAAANLLDFTAHSTPYANVYPQLVNQIDNARNTESALRAQSQLDIYATKLCYLRPGCRIVCSVNVLKAAVSLVTGINMGNTRRPLCDITKADATEVANILRSQGQNTTQISYYIN